MNGSELTLDKVAALIWRLSSPDVSALISLGSSTTGELRSGWSDLDFVAVLPKLSWKTLTSLSSALEEAQRLFDIRIGVAPVGQREATRFPLCVSMAEGKVLQALLELSVDGSRLLYARSPTIDFYVPTAEEVRRFSLLSLLRISLEQRRDCLAEVGAYSPSNYQRFSMRFMRRAFIAAKMTVQFSTGHTCLRKSETVVHTERLLPAAGTLLRQQLANIKDWPELDTLQLRIAREKSFRIVESLRSFAISSAEEVAELLR